VTKSFCRWNRFVHPFAVALDFAFGCHHTNLSRVFTIKGRSYKVCCDCGRKFDYSLREMAVVRPHPVRPAIPSLRAWHT